MKYDAKSVIIGRKPREEGNQFKTAFVKLFNCLDPIYTEEFPQDELDFPNIEKVELNSHIAYYLEGNDIVLNNLQSVEISQEGNTLTITISQ